MATGNQINTTTYNADGTVFSKYENDPTSGKLKKSIQYYTDGTAFEYEYYDPTSCDLMKYTVYNADGSIDFWGEAEYNPATGILIKDSCYNADNSRVEYLYDKDTGELISVTKYDAEGNVI